MFLRHRNGVDVNAVELVQVVPEVLQCISHILASKLILFCLTISLKKTTQMYAYQDELKHTAVGRPQLVQELMQINPHVCCATQTSHTLIIIEKQHSVVIMLWYLGTIS